MPLEVTESLIGRDTDIQIKVRHPNLENELMCRFEISDGAEQVRLCFWFEYFFNTEQIIKQIKSAFNCLEM